MITISMMVNGTVVSIDVEEHLTLVDLLRDKLKLAGTKVACDRGVCGACTVLMDDLLIASCNVFAFEADGRHIETVEANGLDRLKAAFVHEHAVQCGYCTPGMIMAAAALLRRNPQPTRDDVLHAISGNICRCTGYSQIVDAVLSASIPELVAP